jgi:hypothetical protein
MVTVTGQLAIKKVNGRYGEFKVGRLKTSFGEFAVKDAQLDSMMKASMTAISSSIASFRSPYRRVAD